MKVSTVQKPAQAAKLSLNWALLKVAFFSLLTLLPALLMFAFLAEYSVDVPYYDEWELTPTILKLHSGGITWQELWVQHNEHRILFPRLIFLAMAKIGGGWNTITEIFGSFGLCLLCLLLLWRLLALTLRPGLVGLILALSSFLLFSAVQWENWTAGWQLGWFLLIFCVLAAIWLVARWPGWWVALVAAIGVTVVATYTLAGGILAWFVILVGLIVERTRWSRWQIGVWLAAAITFIGLFFYNSTTGSLDLTYAIREPINYSLYVLAYLGAPFGSGWETARPAYSIGFGLAGLLLALFVALYLWRSGNKPQFKFLPWLQLALFGLGSAALAGLGRGSLLGLDSAVSSRYTTISQLFWISLFVGLALILVNLLQTGRSWLKPAAIALAILFGGALLLGYVVSYTSGFDLIKTISIQREFDRAMLYEFDRVPDNLLLKSYPSAQLLKERAWALSQAKESIFRILESQYQDRISKKLNAGQFKTYQFPADTMKMLEGDRSSVLYRSDSLEFQHVRETVPNIYVDATALQGRGSASWWDGWAGQILDIQTKEAQYVQIYWDTGHDLNEKEKAPVFGKVSEDGWKHYRAIVPPGTKNFRVDLYYKTGRLITEDLKVILYYK